MISLDGKAFYELEELVRQVDINPGSHQKVFGQCDAHVSDKCRDKYPIEYRNYIKYVTRNHGRLLCIYCSRVLKATGRDNPNTKYQFDDNWFFKIDTIEKAYFLGWIASDGHVGKRGFSLSIHSKDRIILENFVDIFCKDLPIKSKKQMSLIVVNSQQISNDICRHLKISPGKKSYTVRLPKLSRELMWHFIRGYFDGDGSIIKVPMKSGHSPRVTISSRSEFVRHGIWEFSNLNWSEYVKPANAFIALERKNALKFLDKIYKNCGDLYLPRKYERYVYLKNNYVFQGIRPSGKNHWAYGKQRSEEHRKNLSKALSGEKHPQAKLNWEQVREIRNLYKTTKFSTNDIAQMYGVSRGVIGQITRHEIWKD